MKKFLQNNLVAFIALFFAISTGAAYAAINGGSLLNNSVAGVKIKDETLTSVDIKNRSLRSVDFALGTLLTGPRGATGPQGPQGEIGPQGIPGEDGKPGEQGIPGEDGRTGEQGLTGDTGPQGDTGLQGPKGDTGLQGPKGDTGLQGPKGDTGSSGTNSLLLRTTLTIPTGSSATFNAASHATFVKTRDFGSFNKAYADTLFDISMNDFGQLTSAQAAASCAWQIRVDGVNASGTTSVDSQDTIIGTSQVSSLPLGSVFSGLGAGNHALSLWVRSGDGTTCYENGGNYPRLLVVQEMRAG